MRTLILAAVAAVVMTARPAAAEISMRLDDRVLAARVNGEPVYAVTVDTTLRLTREKQPEISRTKVLEAIITNRVLADAARSRFSEEDLHASRRVAFARDVILNDQLVMALRHVYGAEIEAALRTLPGEALSGAVTEKMRLDASTLDAVLGRADKLQLDYALVPEQAAAARRLALLRYRLPGGRSGIITLHDVYRRQNVQGRLEMYNRNLDYIQQQAMLTLAGIFVQDWAKKKFGTPAVEDLRRALSDQDDAHALQQQYGIGEDIHRESKVLGRLARQVTREEIAAYYQAHREEFQRIERVKARHIRVADEALAQQVADAIARGENFSELARRHSQAEDRKSGGDLGWIVHEGKLGWLAQLAYSQPAGKVSRPIRTPAGPDETASWEIVLVEQRVQGYQAPDSEEVRYVASNGVAREKALKQYKDLREQALRGAKIELNRRQMDEPVKLLADKT